MKYTSLHDLLVMKLQALYDIESELIKAIPKMASAATNPDLKEAFTGHLEETKGHKERLEDIFESMSLKPKKTKSEAIRGLVADAASIMDQDMTSEAMDASLIAAAQYVEHYEMAGYLAAKRWASALDLSEVESMLDENLEEEEGADEKLTGLADASIDQSALGNSDSDDSEDDEEEGDDETPKEGKVVEETL